ncbi:gluconokinase, GntK/IdnK-type [Microbacterium shaanxiense]
MENVVAETPEEDGVRIVVMGPSGSGKSTVGVELAEAVGARFIDGDDLHPEANVVKMAAGTPLDDVDRMPWLRLVGQALHAQPRIVIACSALKREYRDVIRGEEPEAYFAELVTDRAVLEQRMRRRPDHFMPPALLGSQLRTLEPLGADERGVRVIASGDVATAVAAIMAAAGLAPQSLR